MLLYYRLLKMGIAVTVTFEGDELEIRLDNPEEQEDFFDLCFSSTVHEVSELCPVGYERFHTLVYKGEIIFKLNRQGKIMWFRNWLKLRVLFEPDGSLKIMLPFVSSTMKVSLPNAEIPVITTTTLAPTTATSNEAMTRTIICVIVILILAIVAISAVVIYCCWYYRRRHQANPATAPEEHAHQTYEEVPLRNNAVIKSPAPHPKSTHSTPLPSATATTTKPPSTSTTKTSNEKPQIAVVQKPAPNVPPTQQTEEPNCVSIIPASAYAQCSTVLPRSSQLRSKSSVKDVVSIDGSQNL
uniref:CUB domain-containing protein n=1 Tax=Panagrellus redivivus TaxID=6233 RepID=A0A7E4ZT70_PANRE